MHGDLVYFVLGAPDSGRAKAFYEGLFGWRFTAGSVPDGFNLEGPTPPGGFQGGKEAQPPQVYFEVDDLDAALERVRALGGETGEPQGGGAGRYANCRDDQGVEFSIFQAAAG